MYIYVYICIYIYIYFYIFIYIYIYIHSPCGIVVKMLVWKAKDRGSIPGGGQFYYYPESSDDNNAPVYNEKGEGLVTRKLLDSYIFIYTNS